MRSTRKYAAVAAAAAAALAIAACGGGGSGSSGGSSANGKVTLTWWNNGTANPLKGVWAQTAASFHAANPKISISIDPIQNEQFTTKVPLALQGSNPPSLFQQWGGGQGATQVKSGKLVNLSSPLSSLISQLGPGAAGWATNGDQYGVPYDLHMVGFWYRKDLFHQAGIMTPPTTLTQLNADVVKLKAHHIVPIAVGSGDRWPDAFYWDYFAVRECSQATLTAAVKNVNVSAPCFLKAGNDLKAFMATKPFQPGFLGTKAQQGAGSSAGMVANGKAAMELQGDWELGTMVPLTSNKNFASQLGWFPFPSVPGAPGVQGALLGGGDGFSCTTGSSTEMSACEKFLSYIDSPAIQKKLVAAGTGLPANPAAASALTSPILKQILSTSHSAPFIQNYLDIAFPTNVGQALDTAVANFFAGQGTPATIVQQINQSASQQ